MIQMKTVDGIYQLGSLMIEIRYDHRSDYRHVVFRSFTFHVDASKGSWTPHERRSIKYDVILLCLLYT